MIIDLPTPQDFGAKGDGVTDDTAALRAWAERCRGAHGYAPPGTYCYSDTWVFHAPCRMEGAGSDLVTFKRIDVRAMVGNAYPVWSPEVDEVHGGPPIDAMIQLSNMTFAGEKDAFVPPGSTFMAFIGVRKLKMRDVVFRDVNLDLLVLHNCEDMDTDGCEWRDWGIREYDGPVGHYVGGCAVFVWHAVRRLRMTNCDVHDGAGGLWLQDIPETILTGTRVRNTTEFSIVGFGKLSVGAANVFSRVARVDVSGHPAELHGDEWLLGLSIFADADGSCLYVSNPHNVLLPANLYLRPGAGDSCVTVASHGEWAGVGTAPECASVQASLMCDRKDDDPNSRAAHAVLVTDQGGGPMANVVVANNNTGDKRQWRDKPVQTERKGVQTVHND